VLQTAAAIGFEPKFIESDNDHDALNETNAMTPRIFIDIPRCSRLVGKQEGKDTIWSPGIASA